MKSVAETVPGPYLNLLLIWWVMQDSTILPGAEVVHGCTAYETKDVKLVNRRLPAGQLPWTVADSARPTR